MQATFRVRRAGAPFRIFVISPTPEQQLQSCVVSARCKTLVQLRHLGSYARKFIFKGIVCVLLPTLSEELHLRVFDFVAGETCHTEKSCPKQCFQTATGVAKSINILCRGAAKTKNRRPYTIHPQPYNSLNPIPILNPKTLNPKPYTNPKP